MNKYLIAAGSCHHNGIYYLAQAEKILSQHYNFMLCAKSKIYKNCSKFSYTNRLYYNLAFAVKTRLEPLVFYRELRSIESTLGRIRTYKNSPRTLDLDILMVSNLEYKSSTFRVPHTQAFVRSFFVVCAREALMHAGWPTPIDLTMAKTRGGRDYLVACS